MKKKRAYIRLLEKSIYALEEAIASFNGVRRPYKVETALILMTNAWELLGKAVLVKKKQIITQENVTDTITAQVSVNRLRSLQLLDENQEDCIQQIISLRHCASHNVLPELPEEIQHHLMFFGCKFFRQIVGTVFPSHTKQLSGNYLSLSFEDLTTYADKVKKVVAKVKKNNEQKQLAWLLERGIRFEGGSYISQSQFEAQYRNKRKVMSHLAIGNFIKGAEMVRIVPVQAPKNYTADITLRRGSRAHAALPIMIKKTDLEHDYPYLTGEIASRLGKSGSFISTTIKFLSIKGNEQFHQSVRASSKSMIHRYSQAAFEKLKGYLADNPSFNPYQELRKMKPAVVRTTTFSTLA